MRVANESYALKMNIIVIFSFSLNIACSQYFVVLMQYVTKKYSYLIFNTYSMKQPDVGPIFNTYSMKQPDVVFDVYYFEAIKMMSQGFSNFLWRV